MFKALLDLQSEKVCPHGRGSLATAPRSKSEKQIQAHQRAGRKHDRWAELGSWRLVKPADRL